MEEYIKGRRELFEGLDIDLMEPEPWREHPVFHLDLNSSGYDTPVKLTELLNSRLGLGGNLWPENED